MKTSKNKLRTRLKNLKGESVFAYAIRAGAEKDLDGTIEMIKSQAKDNYSLVLSILGRGKNGSLLKEILCS